MEASPLTKQTVSCSQIHCSKLHRGAMQHDALDHQQVQGFKLYHQQVQGFKILSPAGPAAAIPPRPPAFHDL